MYVCRAVIVCMGCILALLSQYVGWSGLVLFGVGRWGGLE